MSLLVIRADGGPGIGSGHLVRCLALAQAWADVGGRAVLASEHVPEWWADRYASDGVSVVPAADWATVVVDGAWAVIDGYRFRGDVVDTARDAGARVLVVADYGVGAHARADAVLDGNLGASALPYVGEDDEPDLLLGTTYTPLRREFAAMRASGMTRIIEPRARHLLVALGGAPPPEAVALVDGTLERLRSDGMTVSRLENVDDVPGLMQTVDLALSAAGSTCWELCCVGVPTVAMTIADNQRPIGTALAGAGAAEDVGWYLDCDPNALADRIRALALSSERRLALSSTGRAIVDGLGASRVVVRLRAAGVAMRRATRDDAQLLFDWANDTDTRAASFTTRPIAWDEHVEWLDGRLRDPQCLLYIASDDAGQPVGQARLDGAGTDAEIAISIAPPRRGEGWAPVVIAAGVRRAFLDSVPVERVVARIRPENQRSISSFDKAGFHREPVDGNATWVQYARLRDGHRRAGT